MGFPVGLWSGRPRWPLWLGSWPQISYGSVWRWWQRRPLSFVRYRLTHLLAAVLAGQAASCSRGSKRGAGMGRSAGSGILLSPSFRDLAVISQRPDRGLRTEGTELLPSCCRAGSSQIPAAQVARPSSSTAWVLSVPTFQ